MPINVPDNPKIYTTTYDNFKGVDFTNDQTNVWRRRSPTGTNMLPDESGRPFKRKGWYVILTNDELCDALGEYSYEEAEVDEESFDEDKTRYYILDGAEYIQCTDESEYDNAETYYVRQYNGVKIKKCSYFELAGTDHIVIFTDAGVVFYNGEVTAVNKEYDCYSGYDRCFYFEGNGTAAFYIYGNFRVWRYEDDFQLHDVTSLTTVPTVLISASADCVGEQYEAYNLLGTKASVEYNDTSLFTYWASDGLTIAVDDTFKETYTQAAQPLYRWKYDPTQVDPNPKWVTQSGGVAFASAGITVSGEPKDDDEIIILWTYGVVLPNNVSDYTTVKVWGSVSKQFDCEIPVLASSATLTTGTCRLFIDDTEHRERKYAWIEFKEQWTFVDGEDFIKTIFPSIEVTATPYTGEADIDTSDAILVEV